MKIVDIINKQEPKTIFRKVAGVEMAQLIDLRPQMLRSTAHSALTTAIWSALAHIRDPEKYTFNNAMAACYNKLRIELSGTQHEALTVKEMFEFLMPKEENANDISDTKSAAFILANAKKRSEMQQHAQTVDKYIGNATETELTVSDNLKLAERALVGLLKSGLRMRNASDTYNENLLNTIDSVIEDISEYVKQNVEEIENMLQQGSYVPSFDSEHIKLTAVNELR